MVNDYFYNLYYLENFVGEESSKLLVTKRNIGSQVYNVVHCHSNSVNQKMFAKNTDAFSVD